MKTQSVQTSAAPAAVGPYSQAVVAGNLVFVSGQIPLDPVSGELVSGDFSSEVRRTLENVEAVLAAAGCQLTDVAKVTVFLTDMSLFGELNETYAAFFGEHRPARAAIEVCALPRGARVEVEAVAVK